MLTIRNERELRENAELIPLIEQVALCVSSGSIIRCISAEPLSPESSDGWVIFQNRETRGFGVNLTECTPGATPLRRRLLQVAQVQKLARCFVGTKDLPLFWTTAEACPEAWRIFRVEARMGAFLCATSFPPPAVVFQGIHVSKSIPKVSLKLLAYVDVDGTVEAGKSMFMPKLCVEFVGQRMRGELVMTEGGGMRVENIESSEIISHSDEKVVMQIDLGEIELSLDQLMAIRAGGVIDLETATPVRCFMRVGTTTLAEGELSVGDGGVSIRVTDLYA